MHLPKPLITIVLVLIKQFLFTMPRSFIKGYLVNPNECLLKSHWWAEPGQNKQNPRSKQNRVQGARRAGSDSWFLRNMEVCPGSVPAQSWAW